MSVKAIRAFIALDLDKKAQAELIAAVAAYQSNVPADIVRMILPENFHITLAFLGQISSEIVPSLITGLNEIARNRSAFRICLTHLDYFPNEEHPKVLAAIIYPAPGLMALQQAVTDMLQHLKIPQTTYDRFLPHLSIAYCKEINKPANLLPSMPLDITSMTHALNLYQSHTEQTGVWYEKIKGIKFKA